MYSANSRSDSVNASPRRPASATIRPALSSRLLIYAVLPYWPSSTSADTTLPSMRRVGIAFAEQPFAVREVIAAAERAEELGFESFWLAQDLWTRRDGLTILSCVAAATQRMHVGSSLLNPYLHHPLQMAMILNTLGDLAPDRVRLGIGSG